VRSNQLSYRPSELLAGQFLPQKRATLLFICGPL
jgi:hypothetical protein